MTVALAPPTLQSIIESIRDLLGQPDPNNSFWTDVELTRYINEAVRIHMAELSSINEGQGGATVTLDLVANVETVALPSDCFIVRALYKVTTLQNVLLQYNNNLTDSYSSTAGGTTETYIPSYYFRGNNLVLRPPPTISETGGLLLEYIAMPASLQDSSDTLTAQISVMFLQSVEMYGVYKAKLKESLAQNTNLHANALANFADLFKQFRELSAKRSRKPTSTVPFDP